MERAKDLWRKYYVWKQVQESGEPLQAVKRVGKKSIYYLQWPSGLAKRIAFDQVDSKGRIYEFNVQSFRDYHEQEQTYIRDAKRAAAHERKQEAKKVKMEDYQKYLQSETWKEKCRRKRKLAHDMCEYCGDEYQPKKGFGTHHLTYERFGNERMTDLLFLCGKCHSEQHPDKEF